MKLYLTIKYTKWYILFMDKAERTKQYIIEKAAPLFNKNGYYGTSLSDLTEATRLTKGSIYGNFDNKDDIAVNCFLFNVTQITERIKSELAGVTHPIERLCVFPKVYRGIYQSVIKNGGCPIANTLIDADDTHPRLNDMAIDVIRGLENSLVAIIDEGKAAGIIGATVASQKTARIVITLFEGGIMLAKATGDDGFMLGAIEQVERIVAALQQ